METKQKPFGEVIEELERELRSWQITVENIDREIARLKATPAAPVAVLVDAQATKPEPGHFVLAWMEGKEVPIRAMWVPSAWLEAGDECQEGWAEYDEEKDEFFCPAGWYEANESTDTYWQVKEPVVAWAELPRRAALSTQPAHQGGSDA